ncbi:hypothetical protein [Caenimonas aquaedulcis]|uniref:Uncharacterized protein n=1 Tax=Caenimonas aquaedulcis TaxID=2793270 RepID=A0A931H2J6_9BURK|nr:hypothetical protein [Caenimonas aquaedulcis]MBG9387357.1 hypothetical protein [Caenimonas aquaedulcis]
MGQVIRKDAEPEFQHSSFVQSCAYCGARFAVFVSRERGGDAEEGYACPECDKSYHTHAALEPMVSLLAARSDGKKDRYQETMF